MQQEELAREFLNKMFGRNHNGYISIWTKQNKATRFFNAEQRDNLIEHILNVSRLQDVYFGVGLIGKPPSSGRGKKDDIIGISGFWIDIDIKDDAHATEKYPPDHEVAIRILKKYQFEPTLVVWSGYGLHAYYRFPDIWYFDNDEARTRAQLLSTRFQKTISGLFREEDFKIDDTHDITRILRVSGTINHKKETPEDVFVFIDNTNDSSFFHTPDEYEKYFDNADIEITNVNKISSKVEALKSDKIFGDKFPQLEAIISDKGCNWMRHCYYDAASLLEPEWYSELVITSFCENPQNWAIRVSENYPKYSEAETIEKLSYIRNNVTAPLTCEYIRDKFGCYCDGCKHKVRTPVTIGFNEELYLEATAYETIQHMLYNLGNDRSSHLDEKVIKAIAYIKIQSLFEYDNIKSEIKAKGCNIADFDKAVKSEESKQKKRQKKSKESLDVQACHYDRQELIEYGFELDDDGKATGLNGNIYADHIMDKFGFVYTLDDAFYLYNGSVYKPLKPIEVSRILRDFLHKHISNFWTAGLEASYIGALKRVAPIVDQMNKDHNYLNLKNGVLDLNTFQLLPHTIELYSTIQIQASYNPDAKCPVFDKVMDDMFLGDKDLIAQVEEIIGYALTSDTKAQKAFIFDGDGSNGKSTLIYVICLLIGLLNVSTLSLKDFERPFARYELINKTLNIITESEMNGEAFNTQFFKAIVSGDYISAEKKHGDTVTFKPCVKILVATNKMFTTKDSSWGFLRRVMIIPFRKRFEGENVDKYLSEKLEMELDGILQRAITGLIRLRKNNYEFTASKSSEERFEEYSREISPLDNFVNDCIVCVADPQRITYDAIQSAYIEYCEYHNVVIDSKIERRTFFIAIKKILNKRGINYYTKKSSGTGYFYCIGIKNMSSGEVESKKSLFDEMFDE